MKINQEKKKTNKTYKKKKQKATKEIGGPRGLEPTRFGDWEVKGRVSDF